MNLKYTSVLLLTVNAFVLPMEPLNNSTNPNPSAQAPATQRNIRARTSVIGLRGIGGSVVPVSMQQISTTTLPVNGIGSIAPSTRGSNLPSNTNNNGN